MKLGIHPSAQILALDWRVSELLRAVEERRPWKPAEQGAVKVLVWRRNARVFHRDLERAEADALEAVVARRHVRGNLRRRRGRRRRFRIPSPR